MPFDLIVRTSTDPNPVILVQDVRIGMDLMEMWDNRPFKIKVHRIDHKRCRNHVHINDSCYDFGATVAVW